MWSYNHTDELYHHGIKGQKWGVRRYQNEDGTLTEAGRKHLYTLNGKHISKHNLNKAIKRRSFAEHDKVNAKYQQAFINNKTYTALGKRATSIGNKMKKLMYNDDQVSIDTYYKLSDKLNDIDFKMRQIETAIGRQYVDAFNDARVKDIGYTGDITSGKRMLAAYNKNYVVNSNGTIASNSYFPFGDKIIYPKNDYLRPENVEP